MEIPLLLVSRDQDVSDKYVEMIVSDGGFSLSHIFHVCRDEKTVKIEDLRRMKRILKRSGERALIIIHNFDTARREAQNALLKTLEEKGERAQFVLISRDESSILPTIISRCKVVRLREEKEEGVTMFDFGKPLGHYISKTDKISKEDAIARIDEILSHVQRDFEKKKGAEFATLTNAVREVLYTRNLIEKNNLNPQMGIDHAYTVLYEGRNIALKK